MNLIIVLSLFAQVCNGQKIETMEEYKVFFDSITSCLKIAEKDSSCYIGKPFPEFVKHLDKCGLKIIRVAIGNNYDWQKVSPQHLYGIIVFFTNSQQDDFVWTYDLWQPRIIIMFDESMPYVQALRLVRKYKGSFEGEDEKFYSETVIKSLFFLIPDEIYKFPPKK